GLVGVIAHLRRVGHIGGDADRIRTDVQRGCRYGVAVHVDARDLRALLGEPDRGAPPPARPAAPDEADVAAATTAPGPPLRSARCGEGYAEPADPGNLDGLPPVQGKQQRR